MSSFSKDPDSSLKSTVKPRYLILGSGSIGFALAKELREINKAVIIVNRDEAKVESPAWHENVLKETEDQVASGQERIADWETAKQELRKRFE